MKKSPAINKTLLTVMVSVLSAIIVLAGTFAWRNFDQRAKEIYKEYVLPEVNLHDDFWEPNKDIYVENSGEASIFVRVNFRELIQFGDYSQYKDSEINLDGTWEHHADSNNPNYLADDCGLNFHKYYSWCMGNSKSDPDKGWKWYIPAPSEARAQYDDNQKYKEGSSKTVYGIDYTSTDENGNPTKAAQISSKGKTYSQINTEMLADETYKSLLNSYNSANADTKPQANLNLTTYAFDKWGVKMTSTTAEVVTMREWIANGSRSGNFWVMDVDGWYYWAEALPPNTATGLLLSELVPKSKPQEDWLYVIDAYLNAVTADDFEALGMLGLTSDALGLLYAAAGEYISTGIKAENQTLWYRPLGQNVYQQGVISVNGSGASEWSPLGEIVSSATKEQLQGETASPSSLNLYAGNYYKKPSHSQYILSSQADFDKPMSGTFKILEIVKSSYNNKYYMKIDENRVANGEIVYCYFSEGLDGKLGTVDDVRLWAGTSGIGSADDQTSPPRQVPDEIILGGTYSGFGLYWQTTTNTGTPPTEPIIWDVLAIDGSKVLLVSHDVIFGGDFASGDGTWADSTIRKTLNQTFCDGAFQGAGLNGGIAKEQIVLTEISTAQINGIKNPGNNYYTNAPSDNGYKADGGKTLDYVFLLSADEILQFYPTVEDRIRAITAYAKTRTSQPNYYLNRERGRDNGQRSFVRRDIGTMGANYQTGYGAGYRPAIWVEFDSTNWGTYGTPGASGTWTVNNTVPAGKKYWVPATP